MERFAGNIIWKSHVFQSARILVIYSAAAVAGLLAGFISASGRLSLIAIFAGLLVMAVVVSYRNLLLWFIIIGGLVVIGLAQLYLPGAKYLRYVIPLATGMLFLHAIMDYMRSGSLKRNSPIEAVVLWPLAFLAIALLSTVANWDGVGVAIMGLKGYFQMWVFFFAFILIQWKREIIDSLPKAILIIALLQLPFVLHQYFFLVPMRRAYAGLVPVDVVAGTFGSTLFGGGANAVLAAFLLIVFACLLGLWKHGALSGTKLVPLSLLLIFPIFINEAKISVVYMAVIFITLFYRDIIDRPLRFIVVAAAGAGIIAALLTALTLLHPSGKLKSWTDLVNYIYEGQTASISERAGRGSELSRWTALTFWAQEHGSANPLHIAIGHGPGASRVQDRGLNLAETLAEKHYGGLNIGYTAISALLWDTGILGLVTVLGFFFAAYRSAGKLTARYRGQDALRAGIFDGLRAGILVLAISLAHKDFFASNIPFQTLVLLIFGYLVITSNRLEDIPQGHRADLMIN